MIHTILTKVFLAVFAVEIPTYNINLFGAFVAIHSNSTRIRVYVDPKHLLATGTVVILDTSNLLVFFSLFVQV